MKSFDMSQPFSGILLLLIFLFTLPTVLSAQTGQYRVPGLFEDYIGRSTLEQIDEVIEDSRWRYGRLYVEPWFGLREISYDDRESSTQSSDLNVTVGAGLRAYVPFGSRFVVAAHALPEYVWWRDRRGRGAVDGRYGLGLFGRSGRVGLEAAATKEESARFLSREFEQRVDTSDDRGTVELDVSLSPSVALFGVGTVRDLEFEDSEGAERVSILNRSEEILRGGIRFKLPAGVILGIGVEHTDVDFDRTDSQRASSGTSPTLEVLHDGARLLVKADLVARQFDPKRGPERISYDEIAGSIRVRFSPTSERFQVEPYVLRDLAYSRSDAWAYYEETVTGLNLSWDTERRVALGAFIEDGVNEYRAFEQQPFERKDDFFTYGGEVEFDLGKASVGLKVSRTEYDSNLPEFSRDKNRISLALKLGGRSSKSWF